MNPDSSSHRAAHVLLALCIASIPLGLMPMFESSADADDDADTERGKRAAAPLFLPTSLVTVTNTNDTGAGSLRNAIATASPGDTVVFSLTLPATITLASQLEITKTLTISGPGASLLKLSGNNTTRVINISSIITLSLVSVTIANGNAGVGGYGGGIFNSFGVLNLNNTSISDNVANFGGGIVNKAGVLSIANSTFYSNSAKTTPDNYGGGIYNYLGGTLTLTNSTFYSNTALRAGGGIYSAGYLTITNSTIAGNTSPEGAGIEVLGFATLRNSIVANNSPLNRDCSGTITSLGNNLDSGSSCAFATTGDITNTNPLLGPLANNGGSTQTMPLLPGSPAIDGVTYNAPNGCPATDQRGVLRPIGPRCDIGAYEAPPWLFLPLILK